MKDEGIILDMLDIEELGRKGIILDMLDIEELGKGMQTMPYK